MGYGQHATPRSRGFFRSVLSWAFYIALVFALVWGLQTFVVCPYTIPSGSMEDTIEVGDNVWSEKVSYYFRDVEQGDIVTFDDPEIAGRTLIKRVIAVGGQTGTLSTALCTWTGWLLTSRTPTVNRRRRLRPFPAWRYRILIRFLKARFG